MAPRNILCCMPHREGGLDQHGSQTQLMRGMGRWGALALSIRALLSETSSRRQPLKVCTGCKLVHEHLPCVWNDDTPVFTKYCKPDSVNDRQPLLHNICQQLCVA